MSDLYGTALRDAADAAESVEGLVLALLEQCQEGDQEAAQATRSALSAAVDRCQTGIRTARRVLGLHVEDQ